jgi:predicted ATP-binding protein involved in virulence
MRVKQLKMQSFRGIGDLTLDFDEKEPTVLVGINGVGKSSILDCLAILLSPFLGRIQNTTKFVRDLSNEDITNGYDETQNEITVSTNIQQEFTWFLKWKKGEDDEILNQLMPLINEVKSNNKGVNQDDSLKLLLKIIQESNENKIDSKIVERIERAYFLGNTIDSLFYSLHENNNANIIAVYYPAYRGFIDINLEVSNKLEFKQTDAYEEALKGGRIDFGIFFQWFRNREDLESELLRDNCDYQDKQLEAVKGAISSLIPGFSKLRVRRSPILRMTLQKNDEELIINQLSDGEKCLLAMVGDLARRLAIANPGLEDPLQGFGVVLIDEIELHLHPKWQRMIIPALTRTFPNCQFIVTTHSPQVISEVKPEGIYVLKKTDNGVIAVRPESSYGRDSNRILEDLMDVPERPEEIKEDLLELFRLIDAGNLKGARQLRQQLAKKIGESEPDFVKADVLIRRKEILKR